ncbi:hypothetical protein PybrP1_012967 [[Pythium] brassicae (nom. inval.)]|nr:hypothetical protein PybrP1_012967 [[Pythium] brassicae (nom. inval.)]
MTDVDAVWKQMQQETPSRNAAAVDRVLRKSAATPAPKTKAPVTAAPTTPAKTEHAQPFNLQREMNRLADEHGSVRKKAALALEAHFLGDSAADADDATEVFAEIAKPLFKRFNDPVEKVRDVCVRVATRFVAREPDLLRFVPYLLPAVTARLNCQYAYDEQQQLFSRDQFLHDAFKRGRVFVAEHQVARLKPGEPSEELRARFLELLAALLENAFARRAASLLHAYIFDILVVLVGGVHDAFPDVNVLACATLRAISDNMVSVAKHFSVALVRAVQGLLLHRLARVRVAAIDAVRALVSCPNRDKCKGSGTEAIADLLGHRDDHVIPVAAFYAPEVRVNCFARLDQDAHPGVRRAFFAMVSDWLETLPDRYDHEARLMPYLLSAVSDEDAGTARDAVATLARLGARYEHEHGAEVLELKQYGVDGAHPGYNYRKPLPAPFLDGRPSLGTRLYVRGRARRFLGPVLRELGNWQSPTRRHAARLLTSIVVYCEETITVDAHVLLQALLRDWREPDTAPALRVVADLVGRFVAPATYLPLLLARVRGDSDVSATGGVVAPGPTATAIEVLQLVMGGSLDAALLAHVHDVLEAVATKHILDFEHAGAKLAVATVAQQLACLLERRGGDAVSAYFLQHGRLTTMERVYDRLFELALVVAGAQRSSESVAHANAALEALASVEAHRTTTALIDAHFSTSVERAAAALDAMSAVQWTPTCSEQLLLEGLLRSASVETVLTSSPVLEKLFGNALAVGGSSLDSAKTNSRAIAYTDALQALLVRVELETLRKQPAASRTRAVDAIKRLQALLSASKAAAA